MNTTAALYLKATRPSMVDLFVYTYMLEGQSFRLGSGSIHCLKIYRLDVTKQVLAICELPSRRQVVMTAQKLHAIVTTAGGLDGFFVDATGTI